MPERSEPTPARPSPGSRAIALLAALVCLVFLVTLRDVALFRPLPPAVAAPMLPSSEGVRHAGCRRSRRGSITSA